VGAVAEAAGDHLTQGSLVGVTGELVRNEWTDKATGEPRHRYFINARSLDLLDFRVAKAPAHEAPRADPAGQAAVEAF
jgi:single-stranded DNA-binding protein